MTRETALSAKPSDETFRQLFRHHAAGVAVITLGGLSPVGFTITSLASVSATPPLLSFNVSRGTARWRALMSHGCAAAHLLRHDQQELATVFATRGADRLSLVPNWRRGHHGLPILPNVLAWMIVETRHELHVGDHSIVIAEVTAGEHHGGRPLVYLNGRFTTVDDQP